jgi:hypothetical protein
MTKYYEEHEKIILNNATISTLVNETMKKIAVNKLSDIKLFKGKSPDAINFNIRPNISKKMPQLVCGDYQEPDIPKKDFYYNNKISYEDDDHQGLEIPYFLWSPYHKDAVLEDCICNCEVVISKPKDSVLCNVKIIINDKGLLRENLNYIQNYTQEFIDFIESKKKTYDGIKNKLISKIKEDATTFIAKDKNLKISNLIQHFEKIELESPYKNSEIEFKNNKLLPNNQYSKSLTFTFFPVLDKTTKNWNIVSPQDKKSDLFCQISPEIVSIVNDKQFFPLKEPFCEPIDKDHNKKYVLKGIPIFNTNKFLNDGIVDDNIVKNFLDKEIHGWRTEIELVKFIVVDIIEVMDVKRSKKN